MTVDALQKSRDLVVAFDERGHTTYRNDAAIRRVADDETLVVNNISAEHQELFRDSMKAAVAGSSSSFEWGESGPAGVRCWYSAEVTPHAGGGICISRDITENERAKERLRRSEQLVVDTQGLAHLGTWEWDITKPTATWSAELYRIYGFTPDSYTPSYQQYLEMVHVDDRQRVIDATNRVFEEHVPYSHDERIHRPDGSIRYLHTWAYPILDDSGALTHLIGVCQDITDRKSVEEALQRLNAELEDRVAERTKRLESALRELEGFNSMVTHDLRAPLAVVQMAVDLIARDPDNKTGKTTSHLERIRRAVRNMSTLMDDLLMLARVGRSGLQSSELDISALCTELVGELRASAPERAVDVVIAPDLRATVDPSLFRAVLANLLGNAWKYSSTRDAARIEVGTVARRSGRALFVRDNGIGFDMADRDKLFRPFERLKNAIELPGTGIGLAIVDKILERHGGSVDAESAPEMGATFFVALPPTAWPPS